MRSNFREFIVVTDILCTVPLAVTLLLLDPDPLEPHGAFVLDALPDVLPLALRPRQVPQHAEVVGRQRQ